MFKKIYQHIVRSWLFEIILAGILGVGFYIYLHLETFRSYIQESSAWVINQLPVFVEKYIDQFIGSITIETLLIIGGVISFSILLIWRFFWRLRKVKSLKTYTCPRCKHPLVRIHRKYWQRILSKVLPVRRLYCRSCGWRGLRLKEVNPKPMDVYQKPESSTNIQIDKIDA